MKNSRLEVMYCVPGKLFPGKKVITARVSDGETTQEMQFSQDYSMRHIHEMVPRMWGFNQSPKRRRAM